MGRGRLEAFSDEVLAISITIMVLELKVPAQHSLAALHALWPTFVSYALSFVYVGHLLEQPSPPSACMALIWLVPDRRIARQRRQTFHPAISDERAWVS